MNFEAIQQKSKVLREKFLQSFRKTRKQVVNQIASVAQKKAEEVTEESIIFAVDRAIDIIQIANQRIRERKIPPENVSWEISVKIAGISELKIKSDVPKPDELIRDEKENIGH
jgi:hypothetical protein